MMSTVRIFWTAVIAVAATACGGGLDRYLGNPVVAGGALPPDVHLKPTPQEVAQSPCKYGDANGCIAKCKREGDAKSCNLAGVMFEFDRDGQDDPTLASGFYRRACDTSYYPACNNLAWLYLGGRGVPQDHPQAMRLFVYAFEAAKTACAHGDSSGCLMAGEFLFEGRGGVTKDDATALSLLDQACASGEPRGCDLATMMR